MLGRSQPNHNTHRPNGQTALRRCTSLSRAYPAFNPPTSPQAAARGTRRSRPFRCPTAPPYPPRVADSSADGHIAQAAILHKRPYCTSGHIAQVAILHKWPHCTSGHIAQVATLHKWPYCTSDHIAQVAILHKWPYCRINLCNIWPPVQYGHLCNMATYCNMATCAI